MTEIANAYGGALYSLAQEEDLTDKILQELTVLADSFRCWCSSFWKSPTLGVNVGRHWRLPDNRLQSSLLR